MSSRGCRRARTAAAGALLLLVTAACSDGTGTDSAGAAPSSTPAPVTTAAEPPPTTIAPAPSSAPAADVLPTTPDTAASATTADPVPTTTSSDTVPAAAQPIPGPAGTSIEWRRIDDHYDDGTLLVPVDRDDPSLGNFRLYLVRRRANDQDERIGSLLVNPGGPGASGAEFARGADYLFGPNLLDHFDIVGWDPRGAYDTVPAIDCIDDYDEHLAGTDITPDTPDERRLHVERAEAFTERCVARNRPVLQHVGTNESARDIDAIRRALGEETISYLGFSYGSELGATWATMFPETVRAAALDGAKDPNAGTLEWDREQRAGFEQALVRYLDDCADDGGCAFHNDGRPAEAYDALMAEIDEHPLPTKPGRPDLTRAMALQAVLRGMYDDALWDQLSDALADAQDGDGEGLLILFDSYYNRRPEGSWPNFLEAFQVIACMDSPDRPTPAEYDANALEVHRLAPRTFPATVSSYDCAFFPPSDDPRLPITGAGAGPIVVVGTTGDPATPLAGTEAMAAALEDGRLIVVDADQHGGYFTSGCVVDRVDRYLIDLEVPAARSEC